MQIIFFSSDIDILDEWRKRFSIEEFSVCEDLISLMSEVEQHQEFIIIADFDSIASDINRLISSNNLPDNVVILERAPEIVTGKMLVKHGIKAYGNSRMHQNHFEQIVATLKEGNVWTYPELTAALIKATKKAPIDEDAQALIENRLTQKEIEVVYLVLEGFTNDAIANKLEITTRTVKAHVSSIFSKLHVTDRISLVLLLK